MRQHNHRCYWYCCKRGCVPIPSVGDIAWARGIIDRAFLWPAAAILNKITTKEYNRQRLPAVLEYINPFYLDGFSRSSKKKVQYGMKQKSNGFRAK